MTGYKRGNMDRAVDSVFNGDRSRTVVCVCVDGFGSEARESRVSPQSSESFNSDLIDYPSAKKNRIDFFCRCPWTTIARLCRYSLYLYSYSSCSCIECTRIKLPLPNLILRIESVHPGILRSIKYLPPNFSYVFAFLGHVILFLDWTGLAWLVGRWDHGTHTKINGD
jgi:hypothetical protein